MDSTRRMDVCIEQLQRDYIRLYGATEAAYLDCMQWAGRLTLECLAKTDAPYHDLEHTTLVASAGQAILRGKHLSAEAVSPSDWLHFTLALLCHDIGYVRGVCRGDAPGSYVTGIGAATVRLRRDATDAALAPYHVDRGKRFVHERFGKCGGIDTACLATHIERTRFPVPDDDDHRKTTDYPGLARAADLIGQLADPSYLDKLPALFREFAEIGCHVTLGYASPDDLRETYPEFYWNLVDPHIAAALGYLRVTREGRGWIRNLYAHLETVEQRRAQSCQAATV